MSPPRRIWVTRTQPQADATAEWLRTLGLEPIVQPVLIVRPCPDADVEPGGADAIAFTSGHAVRAFAQLSAERNLSVFAIGEVTAAIARMAGFADVRSAAGDVQALAETILAAEPRPRLVLAPTAREPAGDLAGLLKAQGVQARAVVVYEAAPVAGTSPPHGIDAVLSHSAKGARALVALISPEDAERLQAFAISSAAAEPLAALPFARVLIAAHPDEASLLALLKPGGGA